MISALIIKLINAIPRSILLKLGYSRIGSRFVKSIRKKNPMMFFEIENGIKIYLDVTNPHTWDLIQRRDPEKKIKEIFLENIFTNNIVIDVGAHIGEFSLIASKKVGDKGKIIALEPLVENVEWLRKNLSLNNSNNCIIFNCAVGDKSEIALLYKKNINATMGFLEPIHDEEQRVKSSKIKVTTIDEILTENKINKVDMLKIDVEGYEYKVLLGCKQSFSQQKIKKILCEIHLEYLEKKGVTKDMIYSLLREYDFVVNEIDMESKTPHIIAYQS